MSAKYSALLEACDKVQLTGKLGILEESSLDEATSIKMKLVLNENINFIKQQLFRTPLVENIQANLGARWTQAILEDIDVDGDTQTAFMKNISGIKDGIVGGFKTIGEKLAPVGNGYNGAEEVAGGKTALAKNLSTISGDVKDLGTRIADAGSGLVNKTADVSNTIKGYMPVSGEKYSAMEHSQQALANDHAALQGNYNSLQNEHSALQGNYNSMQGSQQALANDHAALAQQTSGYGAQAGMALDKSLAANPIATNTALGSAAGLAGYGAYKLGQKVFRRR